MNKKVPPPLLHNLFVYGTLRRGGRNNFFLEGRGAFRGVTKTRDPYVMGSFGFCPFITFPEDVDQGVQIVGELWEVPSWTLAEIDRLESHPDLYKRERIPLIQGSTAWTYLFPYFPSKCSEITSGDWGKRLSRIGPVSS